MIELTDKNLEVLAWITRFMADRKYPPTYEEIRVGMGFSSKSTVDNHLNRLHEAGKIIKYDFKPRGIKLC